MRKALFLLCLIVSALGVAAQEPTEGSLYAKGAGGNDLGDCPLKHTSVTADISGFVTRVRVRQEFENSYPEPIEAIYTFPLSQNGAVDSMTMTIGTRNIRTKNNETRRCTAGLRFGKGRRQGGEPARSAASEHLHAIGREHHARRKDHRRDQLRRDVWNTKTARTNSSSR